MPHKPNKLKRLKKKYQEGLLGGKNSFGMKDPTPKEAVQALRKITG